LDRLTLPGTGHTSLLEFATFTALEGFFEIVD